MIEEAKQLPDGRRRPSLRLLLTGLALSSLAAGAFSFAYPLTAAGLSAAPADMSATWVGLAFSIYFLAKLGTAPVAGWLADRPGPSRRAAGLLLVLACLCASALPLVFMSAQSLGRPQLGLLLVQAGLGLCAGAIRPLALAEAGAPGLALPVGRRLARASLASQLAFLLAPLLGGLLLAGQDIRAVLAFLTAGMLGSALLFGLALPRGDRAPERAQVRPPLSPWPALRAALAAPLTDPLAARLLPAVAGRALGIAAWAAFLPMLLAASLPREPLLFGLLFGLPNLAVCLGLPFTGRPADGPHALRWAAGGLLASSLGLLALPLLTHTAWSLGLAGLVVGLGSAASLPSSLGLAVSTGSGRATVMAVYQSAASLGFVAGPLLGALAVRATGAPEAALGLAGLCGLLCCLPLLWLALPATARIPALAAATALSLTLAIMWPAQRAAPLPVAEHAFGARAVPEAEVFHYADLAMGTIVRLSLEGTGRHAPDAAADKAFALIRALQADLDLRNPHGSVGRVNLNAGREPTRVSPEAFGVIERGLAWGTATDGAFDITVGAVSRVEGYWGLDPWHARTRRGLVDHRLVVLDREARSVFLPKAGMALDLGGLAKGAIIDAAVDLLRREGVRAGIVEAGGDMYCFGPRHWRVGVENPRGPGLLGTATLREGSICGSGDYRRFQPGDDAGRAARRHHILDPRDLGPATGSASVTVVAGNAQDADALATALLVLGPEKGQSLLGRLPGIAALWVGEDRSRLASPGFPALSPPAE